MAQTIQNVLPGRPFGDGINGALTISSDTNFASENVSCSGTSGASTLTAAANSFSNGDIILIHQSRGTGVGQWEVNYIVSGGGTTTFTLLKTLSYTYTDSGASQAQVVQIRRYTNVTVNSGKTWTALAWDGNAKGILTFACNNNVSISGSITASSKGFRGGSGTAANGINSIANQGEGTSGAGTTSVSQNGNGGGGGSNNYTGNNDGAGGGGGGNVSSGGTGAAKGPIVTTPNPNGGGIGGASVGAAALTTADFGGGGGGSGRQSGGGTASVSGGAGGGLIIIFAKNITIESTGSVVANGGNGSNNGDGNGGSSGGGAGGSILIKSMIASLNTTKVTAIKGSGGVYNGNYGGYGGDGSAGRIHLDYSASYTGSTNPSLDYAVDGSLVETLSGVLPYF